MINATMEMRPSYHTTKALMMIKQSIHFSAEMEQKNTVSSSVNSYPQHKYFGLILYVWHCSEGQQGNSRRRDPATNLFHNLIN